MNFKKIRIWIYGGIIMALVFVLAYPVLAPASDRSPVEKRRDRCLANHRMTSLALFMYASDSDGLLPEAHYWMGAVQPFIKNLEVLECPKLIDLDGPHPKRYEVERGNADTAVYGDAFGHALNSRLKSRRLVELPETAILTFDSTDPSWNAFGPRDTPRFTEFAGKTTCAVSYAGGRAVLIPKSTWPNPD